MLDIKDRFEYLFGEHTFPSLYVVFVAEKSYKKMYAFSMVIGYLKILVSTHSNGESILAGKTDYIVKYVNTKEYGHAEYRYRNKKFFDVIFYDAPKGWVEIGCIPKDVSLWNEPELSTICDKREMMKGLSYWSRKGVSFKYQFNRGVSEDEEFIKIATACVNDVFSE